MPYGESRLFISWKIVEGAEIYKVSFGDLSNMREWIIELAANFLYQNWNEYYGRITWCVRAYGSKWDYYTNYLREARANNPLLEFPPGWAGSSFSVQALINSF